VAYNTRAFPHPCWLKMRRQLQYPLMFVHHELCLVMKGQCHAASEEACACNVCAHRYQARAILHKGPRTTKQFPQWMRTGRGETSVNSTEKQENENCMI
jgi:hypothetical protein